MNKEIYQKIYVLIMHSERAIHKDCYFVKNHDGSLDIYDENDKLVAFHKEYVSLSFTKHTTFCKQSDFETDSQEHAGEKKESKLKFLRN